MLFLLNTKIVEVAVPEMHLRQRWRAMGCGEPQTLRAQDAIGFVSQRLNTVMQAGHELDDDSARDLAALVIAKTGANSLTLKPTPSGDYEPRLRDLPQLVLETYRRGADNDPAAPTPSRIEA